MDSISHFFSRILAELYQSIYVLLGGSLDDQTLDWAQRGIAFASVGIKSAVLLLIIGAVYWLFVYLLKHLLPYQMGIFQTM